MQFHHYIGNAYEVDTLDGVRYVSTWEAGPRLADDGLTFITTRTAGELQKYVPTVKDKDADCPMRTGILGRFIDWEGRPASDLQLFESEEAMKAYVAAHPLTAEGKKPFA